jgi:hypothetical protein
VLATPLDNHPTSTHVGLDLALVTGSARLFDTRTQQAPVPETPFLARASYATWHRFEGPEGT